jgi:hypothetical protein
MPVSLATNAGLWSLVLNKAASENESQRTCRTRGQTGEGGQKPVMFKRLTEERYSGPPRPDHSGRFGCLD